MINMKDPRGCVLIHPFLSVAAELTSYMCLRHRIKGSVHAVVRCPVGNVFAVSLFLASTRPWCIVHPLWSFPHWQPTLNLQDMRGGLDKYWSYIFPLGMGIIVCFLPMVPISHAAYGMKERQYLFWLFLLESLWDHLVSNICWLLYRSMKTLPSASARGPEWTEWIFRLFAYVRFDFNWIEGSKSRTECLCAEMLNYKILRFLILRRNWRECQQNQNSTLERRKSLFHGERKQKNAL